MSFSFVFWLLMLLWLVFWAWGSFTPQGAPYWGRGSWLLLFVLLALLGWRVFGEPVHP